ncbi:MAG: HAMP domain-containing sensor histidine kinase, partial [Planctomycetota bacterium]
RTGVELVVEPPPVQSLVLADAQAFRQVLNNLIANAAEAIAESAGGRVRISVLPGPKYVVVEVSDNGPGIPRDVLPHIFTPLFTTKPSGTGLGLAIVRQMMLRQRGDVEVESLEENGTTVRLLLARADDRSPVSPGTGPVAEAPR